MPNRVKNLVYIRGSQEELDKLQSMMVVKYGGENQNVEQSFFNRLLRSPKSSCEIDLEDWRAKNWNKGGIKRAVV